MVLRLRRKHAWTFWVPNFSDRAIIKNRISTQWVMCTKGAVCRRARYLVEQLKELTFVSLWGLQHLSTSNWNVFACNSLQYFTKQRDQNTRIHADARATDVNGGSLNSRLLRVRECSVHMSWVEFYWNTESGDAPFNLRDFLWFPEKTFPDTPKYEKTRKWKPMTSLARLNPH